jgi:hypothetical protein
MITIIFTGRNLIVLDILPKGSKSNQLHFIDHIFPDLKRESVNFHRRIPQATLWVHVNNSIYDNGSKVASKIEKHHVSRLPHPPYSPDINHCDFFLFGMLKGALKDHESNSSDEIEEAVVKA